MAVSDPRDQSIAELLKQLSNDTATLVKQEMALARAEITQQGKRAGLGAGLVGGAGLFGLGAFGALTACVIALLATANAQDPASDASGAADG